MGVEQVDIFHSILKNIVNEGRKRKLPPHIQDTVYDLFCKVRKNDSILEFGQYFVIFVVFF